MKKVSLTLPRRPRVVGLAVILALVLCVVPTDFRENALGQVLGILTITVAMLAVMQEYQRWRRS